MDLGESLSAPLLSISNAPVSWMQSHSLLILDSCELILPFPLAVDWISRGVLSGKR